MGREFFKKYDLYSLQNVVLEKTSDFKGSKDTRPMCFEDKMLEVHTKKVGAHA